MAIAFDVGIEFERTLTTDPQTWSHAPVVNNAPRAVAVAIVHGTSTTDHVVSVTYGSRSLTRIVRATDSTTELGASELWFAGDNIPTGTQTVTVELATSTTDDIHFVSMTFTADSDCEVVDFDSLSENTADPSVTLQYGGRTCLSVAALYGGGAAPTSFTKNANCTVVQEYDLGAFYSVVLRQTTPGTADFTIGGTAANDDVAFVAMAVSEQAFPFAATATFSTDESLAQPTQLVHAQSALQASVDEVLVAQSSSLVFGSAVLSEDETLNVTATLLALRRGLFGWLELEAEALAPTQATVALAEDESLAVVATSVSTDRRGLFGWLELEAEASNITVVQGTAAFSTDESLAQPSLLVYIDGAGAQFVEDQSLAVAATVTPPAGDRRGLFGWLELEAAEASSGTVVNGTAAFTTDESVDIPLLIVYVDGTDADFVEDESLAVNASVTPPAGDRRGLFGWLELEAGEASGIIVEGVAAFDESHDLDIGMLIVYVDGADAGFATNESLAVNATSSPQGTSGAAPFTQDENLSVVARMRFPASALFVTNENLGVVATSVVFTLKENVQDSLAITDVVESTVKLWVQARFSEDENFLVFIPVQQDYYWTAWWVDRKFGERHPFPTKEAFAQRVAYNASTVLVECTDKQKGYSGYLYGMPDGIYEIKGPRFTKHKWTAWLVVDQYSATPYRVI